MKLHNSYTNKIEDIQPIEESKVKCMFAGLQCMILLTLDTHDAM